MTHCTDDLSYLIYGVIGGTASLPDPLPQGVDDRPVSLIQEQEHRLQAVVTAMARPESLRSISQDVPQLLLFSDVVQAFHQETAILPMRFGILAPEPQVRALLTENAARLGEALTNLQGCQEYSIRILLPHCAEPPAPEPPPETSSGSGYLRSRRAYYDAQDGLRRGEARAIERCSASFAELCVRWRSEAASLQLTERTPGSLAPLVGGETPQQGVRLLSLFFLVRREQEAQFRETFNAVSRDNPERWLMSGPWPPHSFVPAPETLWGGAT